ncbi:MAG TPA: crossover junction endodeoxyribonuclease RuvC [Gemmatimonadaceae bacterium]|nr:crossover junction endodeoxyribonuclease RuvC [Gemmatimonadaceae bacterium]
MIVIGVDPGTAATGYGVVRGGEPGGPTLIECGVIRTSARAALARRVTEIFDGILEVIDRHHPDAMAVEAVFYAKNVRTTVVLGHARGVVLLAGERAGLAVHEYEPKVVKKAVVGTGSATKAQVQAMVARLLRLKHAPQPADAADGVACALTCVMATRFGARAAPLRAVAGGRPLPPVLRPNLSRLRAAGGR